MEDIFLNEEEVNFKDEDDVDKDENVKTMAETNKESDDQSENYDDFDDDF